MLLPAFASFLLHLDFLVAPIFLKLVNDMLECVALPPLDVNFVFSICLLEGSGRSALDGIFANDPMSTRPLSIADASNGILALICVISLGRWIGI